MTPAPVRTEELCAAFQLLFRRCASPEGEDRVANALDLVRRGEIDPRGLLVFRGRGKLLGAVLGLVLPGAGALVWPPQCLPSADAAAREDALLRQVADWLRGQGVKIAQALLSPEEARFAAALPRNGFAHITQLWLMRHDLGELTQPDSACLGALTHPRSPCVLEYRAYDPSQPSLFQQTLQNTYEGTLDCPELGEARDVREVVAAHQGREKFDPARWLLAFADGAPVGVLLLAESADAGEWETSYVGVVPSARRRGFGREMMLRALGEARSAEAAALTLSVDARNRPAWELYRDLGFEVFDRREVFLAIWK